jgi:hypothetical protein
MRPVEDLINQQEPGIKLIHQWVAQAVATVEILPPSDQRSDCLYQTQVSTRSPMGAIVYETGGILVDHGWLRYLGSGHERLQRTLPGWNASVFGNDRSLYLFADDALGGFFALNGGALGTDLGQVYYLPYDQIEWEPLGVGFSEFFEWSMSENFADFYGQDSWQGWQEEVKNIKADQCFAFYPFLWTQEGSVQGSHKSIVSADESFRVKMDFIKQIENQ